MRSAACFSTRTRCNLNNFSIVLSHTTIFLCCRFDISWIREQIAGNILPSTITCCLPLAIEENSNLYNKINIIQNALRRMFFVPATKWESHEFLSRNCRMELCNVDYLMLENRCLHHLEGVATSARKTQQPDLYQLRMINGFKVIRLNNCAVT